MVTRKVPWRLHCLRGVGLKCRTHAAEQGSMASCKRDERLGGACGSGGTGASEVLVSFRSLTLINSRCGGRSSSDMGLPTEAAGRVFVALLLRPISPHPTYRLQSDTPPPSLGVRTQTLLEFAIVFSVRFLFASPFARGQSLRIFDFHLPVEGHEHDSQAPFVDI